MVCGQNRNLSFQIICTIIKLPRKESDTRLFPTAAGTAQNVPANLSTIFLGISAFPMSGRIVHRMALEEDPRNFLLMHSIGVNVSGQIASVIAGGIILNIAAKRMGG